MWVGWAHSWRASSLNPKSVADTQLGCIHHLSFAEEWVLKSDKWIYIAKLYAHTRPDAFRQTGSQPGVVQHSLHILAMDRPLNIAICESNISVRSDRHYCTTYLCPTLSVCVQCMRTETAVTYAQAHSSSRKLLSHIATPECTWTEALCTQCSLFTADTSQCH